MKTEGRLQSLAPGPVFLLRMDPDTGYQISGHAFVSVSHFPFEPVSVLRLEAGYTLLSMYSFYLHFYKTMRLQLRLRGNRKNPSINRPSSSPCYLSISAHLLPGVGFPASAPLRKHCPAPGHCKPRTAGASTCMKGPIVQHPCKGFVLRFSWGQGNAESQLTTRRGRVKLCSFDSPRAGTPFSPG